MKAELSVWPAFNLIIFNIPRHFRAPLAAIISPFYTCYLVYLSHRRERAEKSLQNMAVEDAARCRKVMMQEDPFLIYPDEHKTDGGYEYLAGANVGLARFKSSETFFSTQEVGEPQGRQIVGTEQSTVQCETLTSSRTTKVVRELNALTGRNTSMSPSWSTSESKDSTDKSEKPIAHRNRATNSKDSKVEAKNQNFGGEALKTISIDSS